MSRPLEVGTKYQKHCVVVLRGNIHGASVKDDVERTKRGVFHRFIVQAQHRSNKLTAQSALGRFILQAMLSLGHGPSIN